jgi:hypothetical protein
MRCGQCDRGVYPFMYGTTKDFQPVVEAIVAAGLKPPYDWDEYASYFLPHAGRLAGQAQDAEREGNKEKASELYLYATYLFLFINAS